ncbi:MAG: YfhO family protein [Clostridiales bacterium]|nr:YfhO family protein [Clostridiales bacterium]
MKSKELRNTLLCFVISLGIMLVAMAVKHIYPFGDGTMIYHDMEYQYIDFMAWFMNMLHGRENFSYSFSIGMGQSVAAMFSYYLASPFNLLLIFANINTIVFWITVIMLLKVAACSVTMYVYLSGRFELKPYMAVMLSVSYAMMGYNVLNCSNIMWLDAVIVLPLLALGMFRFINYDKKLLYFAALFYGVGTCWYTGYMLCVFMVLLFGIEYFLYCGTEEFKLKKCFMTFVRFGILSVLACLGTLFVLLPAIIKMTEQGEGGFFEGIDNSLGFMFDIAWRDLFLNRDKLTITKLNPPIYVGILPLVGIANLFISREVTPRTKKLAAAIIIFGMLTFIYNPLNYAFSMFKVPNNHNFRHAFLYSFLLVFLAAAGYSKKNVKFNGIIILAVLLISNILAPYEKTYLFFSMAVIIIISALLYLKDRFISDRIISGIIVFLMVTCVMTEFIINWSFELNDHSFSYEKITSYNSKMLNKVNHIFEADSGTYRIGALYSRFADDKGSMCNSESMAFGYSSPAHYSSTYNLQLSKMLMRLGYSGVDSLIPYNKLPVMDSLLGIKYVFGDNMPSDYKRAYEVGDFDVYKNEYDFGMAYQVKSFLSEEDLENNPFINQIKFFNCVTGADSPYTVNNFAENNNSGSKIDCDIVVMETGPLYIWLENGEEYVRFYADDKLFSSNAWFSSSAKYAGEYKKGDRVNIRAEIGFSFNRYCLYSYTANKETVRLAADAAKERPVNLKSWKNGHIIAETYSDNGSGVLFTIPYESGWKVKVNGRETEYRPFAGGLIYVDVPAGACEITLDYQPPGLITGFVLSILAVFSFVLWEFYDRNKKQANTGSI